MSDHSFAVWARGLDPNARAEAAEHHAENMYQLWTKDREKLHRWQLACLILILLVVSGVAGLAWSHVV